MKQPGRILLIAGLLASTSGHAQFVQPQHQAAPYLKALEPKEPFSDSFQPTARTYARNEAANQNDKLFKGLFKTDPRLLFGVSLTPNIALEAGYVDLLDRGFHRIDERDAGDMNGALGTRGFSIHAAARVTLPVSERLSVFGKLGVAQSARPVPSPEELARMGISAKEQGRDPSTADRGLFSGAGVTFKVNRRTSVVGEYSNHGDVKKWGPETNAGGFKANLKMGF